MQVIDILYDFTFISALIFLSKIIRSKIKCIQRLYIPTALIAGFLGLLLGKQVLNVIPFTGAISSYSGILISILFATMFLGNKEKASFKNMMKNVGDTFLVNGAAEISQYALFTLIGVVFLPLIFKGIHAGFGLMLPAGFIGGHGTAAAIGSAFGEMGWDEATSIGQTFATVGLLFGILCGVALINICVRRGKTKIINNVNQLPQEMLTGLVPSKNRVSVGDATVNAMSLDTLTWHVALVLIAVGMAYGFNNFLKIIFPQVSFPVYGLALICSIILQSILRFIKMDDYVDKKIVVHIGSSVTDYLVAFGVASINLNVVIKYWVPILLLTILGAIFVICWFFLVSPKFYKTYPYERGIYLFGMSTGVMATGVILLRITDPEFKSGVLEDYGFAWIFLSFVDMLLVSLSPVFVAQGLGIYYCSILLLIALLMMFICKRWFANN